MDFKFKKDAKQLITTEDPWYGITDGGYIKPEYFLEDEEQIAKLYAAVNLVHDFFEQLEEQELIYFA